MLTLPTAGRWLLGLWMVDASISVHMKLPALEKEADEADDLASPVRA